MKNALTIDVEDWFQVSAFEDTIGYERWADCESKIVPNVHRTLALLDEVEVKATFFVLGWIAKRYPEVVLTIQKRGHEISTHGYAHRLVYDQTRDEFKDDVEKSIDILQSITGQRILGYRAPSYSIVKETLWAWETLVSLGIKYDSSIFPIKHDRYGMPSAPRYPFAVEVNRKGKLIEFPLSTITLWGKNVPIAGGGYLRLYPYWFIRRGLQKINSHGHPAIVYFHPWELDPGQPRRPINIVGKFRHYGNLALTESKIRTLLRDFEFVPLRDLLSRVTTQDRGVGQCES